MRNPAGIALVPSLLPAHVAVIMDGNGRWAEQRSLPRTEGHRAGSRTVRAIVTECRRLGIEHLTLYAFSRENWGRPPSEVTFLFGLLVDFLQQEVSEMIGQDIRLNVLGDLKDLPLAVRAALRHSIKATECCRSMRLNLALNYSGREEILYACKALLAEGITAAGLTEDVFAAKLWTCGQPDPDLVIRTSGEFRISNFLLFQSAYSEYYFTSTLWPDFGVEEFHAILAEYAQRQRRFGKTSTEPETSDAGPGKNQEVHSA